MISQLRSYTSGIPWTYYFGGAPITLRITVPKGTYANLAAAQAALAGTKIWYQLATPIVTPISIPIVTNGIADTVLRAWQNGSVSVEYEGTLPTINYKYPLQFENLRMV